MFKQFISNIPGADVYMIFSLLLFLVFFILVGIYLLKMDKSYLNKMEELPMGDAQTDSKS
ncbi:hypothetical protein EOJ36_00875 [Sandaracinomonas limnophila]|uniref:CcoQ/FixQ family Cbb3-type cytochrome c oxidase assembly chaperone n=1 Tax=Sandaracinomonas limnophila TaxID=1862386 RepID=A0A437PWK6_9BACT|nr:hypothetical protein [Sandaracinomonas limnophila]RVU26578.1 hypothetical protein EOJ36_00875 [Sandaracinomonas limnophila]